jgi:hypothetical protein
MVVPKSALKKPCLLGLIFIELLARGAMWLWDWEEYWHDNEN